MKLTTLLPCLMVSMPAIGSEPNCECSQHRNVLTYEEWQAVIEDDTNGDPVLEEAAAAEKAKYDKAVPVNSGKPIPITWDQAQKLVLLGLVHQTEQAHNLTVHLYTRTNRIYVTQEPKIDEISRISRIVDPCNVHIQHFTE